MALGTINVADSFTAALHDAGATADSAYPPFAEFVSRHRGELIRYLRSRVSNEEDVADLAQECYMRLLRYRDGHSEASLQLLQFRIANNLLTDAWRIHNTHKTEDHVSIADIDIADEEPAQDEILHERQRLARLRHVIEKLPPRCQAVFILSRFEGLSHAEVARRCGISIRMVEKHITRALTACRAELGKDDV